MYKKILVPLDGSKLAEITLDYTAELIKRLPGVEVDLLHVYNPRESAMAPMYKAYIEQAVDTIRKRSADAGPKVNGELAVGNPADKILHFSNKHKTDLIIMATHGRSGINRWAMGSITYKVMRSGKKPVCLIRAGIKEKTIIEKASGHTVLVPLDGTRRAESVLPYVERLVKQIGADKMEVVLLMACAPPKISSDYPSAMPLTWEEHVEREQIQCKLVTGPYLAEVSKRLKNVGLRVQVVIPLGKPAKEIVKYAEKNESSLIAMSTHGRSGISRWAYGSIAEQVMLGTLTPVLMVGQK